MDDYYPNLGDKVTYYDDEGVPHRGLVTWVLDDYRRDDPHYMISCVRQRNGEFSTDARDGDYDHEVINETSVDRAQEPGVPHHYVPGWRV